METTSIIMEQSSPIFNVPSRSCRREIYSSFNMQSKDHNHERMFSSIDESSIPKKENFLQSMFGTVSNLFEQVSKARNSIISSFNVTPLSVTLVENESMISNEIIKTLIKPRSNSIDDSERIKNTMVNHDSLISHQVFDGSQGPKYLDNKMKYEEDNMFQTLCSIGKNLSMKSENSLVSKPSPMNESENSTELKSDIGLTDIIMNTWQKVFKTSPAIESKEDEILKKRPNHKSKNKVVANCRGRGGRAKLQLKHSRVSQTRHKKEGKTKKTKHDLEVDIQEDLDAWEELRLSPLLNDNEDNTEPIENHVDFTFADISPRVMMNVSQKHHSIVGKNKTSEYCPRVKFVSECTMDINFIQNSDYSKKNIEERYRPRLISESSIDSEDSYCIVFESGLDSPFENDSDSSFISDDEDEDDEQTDCVDNYNSVSTECKYEKASQPKVRFNLKPITHLMIHWNYAYRAARIGHWEEMVRDRDRFNSRIKCTKLVLDPILTTSHRAHIWRERFS